MVYLLKMVIFHGYVKSPDGNLHNLQVIFKISKMGVSENVVYPIVPNGFADHYPVLKNGYKSLGLLTQHFQTNIDKPKFWGYIPNEIAICYRDNAQQNHWVQWGTQHFQTHPDGADHYPYNKWL